MARNKKAEDANIAENASYENQDAPMQVKSNSVNLTIAIGFNDKYTGVEYKVGDVVPFDKTRAAELLADPRKLVSETK